MTTSKKRIVLPNPERLLEYINEFSARQIKKGEKVQLALPSIRTLARAVRDQSRVFIVDEVRDDK